jgi:outer membrane protein TolC
MTFSQRRRILAISLFLLVSAGLGALRLSAQVAPEAPPLSLQQVVETALRRYPAVRISEAEVRSSAAGIQLARTAYLPQLDAIAGVNRATRNNVFGLLLPSQVIAPISGPVLGTNGLGSAWGSTVGILMTWEPFDFGLRQANVSVAEAVRARSEASVVRTRLDVATVAADTVLTLVAAEQTVIAAQAAVDRAAELFRLTDALVRAELRPGAESSLARAEQASAQAQLIRARQAVAETRATLAAFLGAEPAALKISAGRLLTLEKRRPAAISRQTPLRGRPMLLSVNPRLA